MMLIMIFMIEKWIDEDDDDCGDDDDDNDHTFCVVTSIHSCYLSIIYLSIHYLSTILSIYQIIDLSIYSLILSMHSSIHYQR
jgi:hypothetical protein